MKPEAKIAIITTRVNATLTNLHSRIERYSAAERQGTFKDGRPFFIATADRHLRGVHLLGYEVDDKFNDLASREMKDIGEMKRIAEARLYRGL